jgi:S1-C subfamily serine protease
VLLVSAVLWLLAAPGHAQQHAQRLEQTILRAKPAVVLISSEVGARLSIACGAEPPRAVEPDPVYETGTGFIIHPDGYVATNGHVVERFYEMNERSLGREFAAQAAAAACGDSLAGLSGPARADRLRAIGERALDSLTLRKKLQVHLSTGAMYAAEVKAYSPALNPAAGAGRVVAGTGTGAAIERSGKDIALLKIEASDLPAVPLADRSAGLKVGEQIFIIGYPGVVLNHDFLSRKSRLEASVTVGRVSGFKIDLTDRRVIQTDAAITWGNSGGPAFNARGEVIGAATFISTTLEGDQAIQGFNFLIPVETVHEYAREVGLTPRGESAFTREWEYALQAFFRDEYRLALRHLDAADRLLAGLPDVQALRAEAQFASEKRSGLADRSWKIGGGLAVGLGASLLVLAARGAVTARLRRLRGRVRRLSPDEVRRQMETGSPAILVDARHGSNFDDSAVQVAGAARYDIERPKLTFQLESGRTGEVIAYCD